MSRGLEFSATQSSYDFLLPYSELLDSVAFVFTLVDSVAFRFYACFNRT